MAQTPSIKQLQIDKETRNVLLSVSLATFVFIFTLVAGKSLFSIYSYQNRVISAQSKSVNQLNTDVTASKQLLSAFNKFNNTQNNILGKPTNGGSAQNDHNANIILDALPLEYDYAAFAASLQALVNQSGAAVTGVTESPPGSASASTSTIAVAASPIQFSFTVKGSYQSMNQAILTIEKSIRPFQIQSIALVGSQASMTMSVNGVTYYKPGVSFTISKENIQ